MTEKELKQKEIETLAIMVDDLKKQNADFEKSNVEVEKKVSFYKEDMLKLQTEHTELLDIVSKLQEEQKGLTGENSILRKKSKELADKIGIQENEIAQLHEKEAALKVNNRDLEEKVIRDD